MKTKTMVLCLALGGVMFIVAGCSGFAAQQWPRGVATGKLMGDVTYPSLMTSHTQIQLTTKDFTILKTVTAEAESKSILGMFSSGDNGFAKLFDEARAAGADDVINVRVDTREESRLSVFWCRATTRLTGTAIKWNK